MNKPILRWAGGKWHLINYLKKYLPVDYANRRYCEPFLGAGSLFFSLKPQNAFISDLNEHLINCYQHIRDNPKLISTYLQRHSKNTSEDYYYGLRDLYNKSADSIAQAARFIYLNRTCFNGIFRVNLKGEFNVPYGWKEPPPIPTFGQLLETSKSLEKTRIEAISFDLALAQINKKDFIYLDPPYPPLNGTSFFTHYTSDRFLKEDQKRLAQLVKELDKVGCKILMSNADTKYIRELYKKFNISNLSVRRWVTSKAVKHQVSELVITNYDAFYS